MSEASSEGTTHSVRHEEQVAFSDWINAYVINHITRYCVQKFYCMLFFIYCIKEEIKLFFKLKLISVEIFMNFMSETLSFDHILL